MISKFKCIILIFLLFFEGIVKSCYFKKVDLFESCFCVKSQLQYFNSLEQQWLCKKQWISKLLQKIEKNEHKRFEFSDKKVYGFGLQPGLKLVFKINYTMPGFLWNVNFQIAPVYSGYNIISPSYKSCLISYKIYHFILWLKSKWKLIN